MQIHLPMLADAATQAPAVAQGTVALVVSIIFVALVFDFFNGFHDAANSVATIVSTRVLTPMKAVLWAAFFNFVAAFLFGTGVAQTIGSGLINTDPHFLNVYVVLAGLTGAIAWDIITWLMGLPTSSSHALVSAAAGAAIAKNGFGVLLWSGWLSGWGALLLFLILSPVIGFILGAFNMTTVAWLFRHSTPSRVDKLFRRLQFVSASLVSLGHGGNDSQKTMGIIFMLLGAAGMSQWAAPDPHHWFNRFDIFGHFLHIQHNIAWWIILICNFAMGLGTAFGGWRIVKTMGTNITRLQPVGGFCAEGAAATTMIFATVANIPISTTHAITGSILGVGSARSIRSVRWIWGERIVIAWILTIPCSAFMAAVAYLIITLVAKALGG